MRDALRGPKARQWLGQRAVEDRLPQVVLPVLHEKVRTDDRRRQSSPTDVLIDLPQPGAARQRASYSSRMLHVQAI
jgi:hypothetical protein